MKWEEYISKVLIEETYLNDIVLGIEGQQEEIPDIIKASVYLLEKMIANQGRYNMFVFPEGKYTPFILMLSKLIYNIGVGKIESSYDVHKFVPGQKLRFGKSIAEFIKVDFEPALKDEAIYLKFADCTLICKKQYAPYFQTVDTKKRLSKQVLFNQEKKRIEAEGLNHNTTLNTLTDMKTHMAESIMYISSVSRSQEYIREISIDSKELTDYFFISQTDYTGKLQTVKGLYSGIPALILSSNLAYALEAVKNGAKAQLIIVNLNDNDLDSQLAELDELIRLKVTILCVADTIHSFDTDELKRRGFNTWRWDKDSITTEMCNENSYLKEKNGSCKYQKVHYVEVSAPMINEAFQILYGYRKSVEECSATMSSIYGRLFELASAFLRRTYRLTEVERVSYQERLEKCKNSLASESAFIEEKMSSDFNRAIKLLTEAMEEKTTFPKMDAIREYIYSLQTDYVCIVISNSEDSVRVRQEWVKLLYPTRFTKKLLIMTIREFINRPPERNYTIILSGWFGAKVTRQVIYGYDATDISVFLYLCETRWKNAHTRSWKNKVSSSNNREIVKQSFSKDKNNPAIDLAVEEPIPRSTEVNEIINEQDDTDLIIQENRFRQLITNSTRQGGTIVEACPVSFVGGEFALFTKGHKSLVVTDIIHQRSSRILEKDTEELKVGDFIVIREASRDIIREVADKILIASGRADSRKKASLWKEALKIEQTFSSLTEIYEKLKNQGCTKNFATVRNWIVSEDIIIPQSKEDLVYIAKATGDDVLLEKLDSIFEEGTFIKRAHIKAGNLLSDRLTACIAERLISDKMFDPYNVWDPIEINLEDVGLVRIYKLIDISQEWLSVNSFDTNRIMSEEKEI